MTAFKYAMRLMASVAVALTLVPISSAAPASAAISPESFESCLLDRINADRDIGNAPSLQLATDLTDQVRDWSEWMRYNDFRHMNNAERAPILPDGTTTWGENIAWHSSQSLPDCSSIHNMLMNSPGHRASILNGAFRYAALGTYVDGSGWWVTELFFNATDYSPECRGTFCDDDSSVFEGAIEKVAAAGITQGCNPPSNTKFCPNSYVTRGAMAAFLSRALKLPNGQATDFVDDNDSVFEGAIQKIAAAGITQGCNPPSNTKFCPNSYVTRGQMAAFLARALRL